MSSLVGITEVEDLTLFLQERIQEFDSDVDSTTGSFYYNTVIQPLLDRLAPDPYNTPIREFCVGRLTAEFPDLVIQDGDPLDDLVIKPMQILLEAYRRQIQQVSNNQSLEDPSVLNEREADALGANFFVRRRQGGLAVGLARIYFSAPRAAVVTPNNAVYDGEGHRFFPVSNQAISASDMLFRVEDNLYYFDFLVRAEQEGEDYNISPNSLTGIEEYPGAVKVTNKSSFEEGEVRETTEEYIARIENSLTEKSLVTARGIRARLTDVFETIRLIQVIGHGDPEMNRDIITGELSLPAPYLTASVTTAGPGNQIDLATPTNAIIDLADSGFKDTFTESGVEVGDVVTAIDETTAQVYQYVITEVQSQSILVTPNAPGPVAMSVIIGKPAGAITISDIPGGILEPETAAGEIIIEPNQVHIGGAVDVFIRAGAPAERDIVLEGTLDGDPLHFGVDLESFGEREDEFVHLTGTLTAAALRPSSDRFGVGVSDHLLVNLAAQNTVTGLYGSVVTIDPGSVTTHNVSAVGATFVSSGAEPGQFLRVYEPGGGPDDGDYEILEVVSEEELLVAAAFSGNTGQSAYAYKREIPWLPAEEDVGRYVEIMPSGAPGGLSLLEVLTVEGYEYFDLGTGPLERVARITVDTSENHYNPGNPFVLGNNDSGFDTDIRLVETVSPRSRVRDRDGSRLVSGLVPSGKDLAALGATVGDSVVLETGADAGIYSIRRILSWLDDNDTLILDRNLTKTHTPTGLGDGSGLRYRIADELNVDLVSPKVTKIPLGSIFSGNDLVTVSGSSIVSVSGDTNFLLAGVEDGDTLEVLSGDDRGEFTIQSVTGTAAALDGPLQNTASPVSFTVYRDYQGISRPMVRVNEIELLDSNSQPTGGFIPYGEVIDARALGVFSNRAEGSQQESFTGVSQSGTGSLQIRLYDNEVDFVAEGVVPGWRLNVFSTANEGRYTVSKVGSGDGLPSDHYLEVEAPADGGVEFAELVSAVHYSVGLPSAGVARLYFQDPTSVEIDTGLSGGRINYEEEGTPKQFHFSEVDGYRVTPPAGEANETSRDIRVVRSGEVGAWKTVLELTDSASPGVFEQELKVGDVVEVNEQIKFRATGGRSFDQLGIFGTPAGLRTVAGSNRVTVPTNSLIDFSAMDSIYPLAGQLLYIDEGPDEGQYLVEEVIDSKTLRLNQVMTGTTETIVHKESPASLRDATLTPAAPTVVLQDLLDNPGTQIGNYITIFESTRGDIDGTFEIKSIPGASQVELSMNPSEYESVDYVAGTIIPFGTGLFSWVNTEGDTNIGHQFRLYRTVPTQSEITQVAAQRDDLDIQGIGTVSGTPAIVLTDPTATFLSSVVPGDQVEVLSGDLEGVYPIASVDSDLQITIVNNPALLFPGTASNVPYRIWSGLHGSRTLLTVSEYESDNGFIEPGESMPFRIVRPGVYRVSSTEMQDNEDGGFYYVDIQVESLGSGDEYNLNRLDRMVVKSGARADGYTYTVENNNLTFSPFEQVSLNFDRRFLPVGNSDSPDNMTEVSGRNLRVSYGYSESARLVHDLMRSDSERPITSNPLGRHFLPSYVYVVLSYRGGPSSTDSGQEIENYINNLGAEDELEVSDLEAFLSRRGADSIEHPIPLAAVTHDIDRRLVVNRTENRLGGNLAVPYSGTGRTSCFFATLGEGLIVEKLS